MALDLIDEVGPGGEFLTSDHTLRHFRENWFPKLLLRNPYDAWDKSGRLDLGARANARVKRILAGHSPRPLEERLQAELRELVRARDV